MDEQFILRRQEQLEFTLQSLLTHPNLEVRYSPELRFFLDRDYPPPAFQLSNAAIQGGLKMEVMRVMEGVSSWRTRYAVVQNHHLYIYLSPLDHTPERIVHLDGYLRCVYSTGKSSSTHAFQLVSRHTPSWPDIHFATETPEERKDWSAALTQAMEEAHDTVLTLFAEAPPMPTIVHSTYQPGDSDAEDAGGDDAHSDGEEGEAKPPRPSEATQGPSIVLPSRVQAVTTGAMAGARKSLNLGLGPLVIPEGEKPPPVVPKAPSRSSSRSKGRGSSGSKSRSKSAGKDTIADAPTPAPATPAPPAKATPAPVANIEDVPNKAVIVFAYDAATELELSLDEQAKVQILEEADDGWARVRDLATGSVGLYPMSYYEKLP